MGTRGTTFPYFASKNLALNSHSFRRRRRRFGCEARRVSLRKSRQLELANRSRLSRREMRLRHPASRIIYIFSGPEAEILSARVSLYLDVTRRVIRCGELTRALNRYLASACDLNGTCSKQHAERSSRHRTDRKKSVEKKQDYYTLERFFLKKKIKLISRARDNCIFIIDASMFYNASHYPTVLLSH